MHFAHIALEALFLFGGGFGLWMAFRAFSNAHRG